MNAQQLKNAILQEAIQGRLVPQDPTDEPASALLERIRGEKERLVKAGKLKKKDLEVKPISEDEIPFEIPDSWEWVRLGEVSTYANTKKKVNASAADPNLWGLDLEDIERGGRLLAYKTVGERKAVGDKTCFSAGDILYSKLRPYLLKILVAPKDGICTPEIIPFTCYGEICKEFVVNLLKSVYVDEYINSVTFGVKMPRVSTETMTSLVIPLPPLAEQKRIVAKIEELLPKVEEYGKAKEALDKLNAELPDRLKKSVLQEAIEGRLVPQDPTDEPASVLLAKIRQEKEQLVKAGKLKKKDLEVKPISEDEIPFEIPDSWEWVRLGFISEIVTGKKDANNGDENGNYYFFTCSNTPLKSRTYSYDGDYLIMPGNGANIGQVIHFNGKFEAYQRTYLLKTYATFNLEYLKYHLICNWKEYNQDKLFGSAIPYIKLNNLLSYPVALPPLAEQKRIVAKIEQVLGEIDKLKK